MRGLLTSALFASTWATTLALHTPVEERRHHVEMEDSANNAPTEAVVQRLLQDLDLPDLGNPNLENENAIPSQSCLEDEIAQLKYMRAQLRELQALIAEQELAIARHRRHIPILECDNLACVARSIRRQARNAATIAVDKCKSSRSSEQPRHSLASGQLQNLPHRQEDQEEADQIDIKALTGDSQRQKNERRPLCQPSLSKKLDDLLPVCQYPSPSQSRPSTPHLLLQQSPPHTTFEQFTGEPHDDPKQDQIAHTGIATSSLNEHHQIAQKLTRFSAAKASVFQPHKLNQPPNSPQYMTIPLHHQRPSRGSQSGLSLMIVLSVFILAALHRRWRRSAATATLPKVERRHSRRAERFYRRAMRRAAQKKIITDVLARLGYQRCSTETTSEDEAKGSSSLLGCMDGESSSSSTTMGDDISEFRNIADIVAELIAAEEGRSRRSRARRDPVSVSLREAGIQELSCHSQDTGVDLDDELPVYEVEENENSTSKGGVVDGDGCSSTAEHDASQLSKDSDISGKGVKE